MATIEELLGKTGKEIAEMKTLEELEAYLGDIISLEPKQRNSPVITDEDNPIPVKRQKKSKKDTMAEDIEDLRKLLDE